MSTPTVDFLLFVLDHHLKYRKATAALKATAPITAANPIPKIRGWVNAKSRIAAIDFWSERIQ